jgi:AraC family transcriptional regulator
MRKALPSSNSIPANYGRYAIIARSPCQAAEPQIEMARPSIYHAAALIRELPTAPSGGQRGGLAPWQAQRAISPIDERVERRTRIYQLAANLTLSRSHFCRAFKKSFGCSPRQFLLERRIWHAQRLMLVTNGRLCDIAQACGFSDQSYFSRVFNTRRIFAERMAPGSG